MRPAARVALWTLLIVLGIAALGWAAHTGGMRECLAAQEAGIYEGEC